MILPFPSWPFDAVAPSTTVLGLNLIRFLIPREGNPEAAAPLAFRRFISSSSISSSPDTFSLPGSEPVLLIVSKETLEVISLRDGKA
jgi:hypothetical protein